jgi:ABC-2 type transport system permease protein
MSTSEGVRLPIPRRAPVSHRVHGPSALGDDLRRFWSLTFTLARTEFKLRFYGSVLGYVWTLVRPLLFFGVLYVFFTEIGHVNDGTKPGEKFYGAQLLASIVLFQFFAEATTGAVRSVVDRENLVRKIHFPRLVIPLSVVLLALFNLGLNLIVVLVFALAEGVTPMLSWLELPLIVGALIVCATGVAMLLAALFVHFRDIQPIWEVIQQILFYASPVIISIETVIKRLSTTMLHVYMLNPLAVIFQQFRHAMINNASPGAGQVLGSWAALGGALAIVLAIFVAGFMVFNRAAAQIAENL